MAMQTSHSIVVPVNADLAWKQLRSFDFPAKFFSTVKSVNLLDGASPTSVGGEREVIWHSEEKQKHKLVCLDDENHRMRWELVGCDPAAETTAQQSTLRVIRISENNSALIEWTVEFSADVTPALLKFQLRGLEVSGERQ
eukprot:TRINITY_DN36873_c0_g1_i1.p1 TRINITY_DN36873_c0_g1~~TRINITY_DN36873_c0_g1_i1.p1  ORF type:complete len:140 (+),score=6.95 TRINITY_DN36873_c0_g1_i1:45-464(+)